MNNLLPLIIVVAALAEVVYCITCVTGFRLLKGQTFGTETEECEDETAYCYNMTAEAAFVVRVMKAGCSKYRCLLSQNTCRSISFQGVPVSFCCCNDRDLCNYTE